MLTCLSMSMSSKLLAQWIKIALTELLTVNQNNQYTKSKVV